MKKILIIFLLFIYALTVQAVYALNKNTVYIYKDDGVSEESLAQTIQTFEIFLPKEYLIKTINAQGVKHGIWTKDAVLFVMPGGADLSYVKKLNGAGNHQIKQYVQKGGNFLGICAGAYYVSAYVEFDKKGSLEVLGNRELKFFPGKSIGPILAPYDYNSQKGSRAAKISTVFSEVPKTVIYYNGGGFFENAEKFPNIKVIATYDNSLPAIIIRTYGKGKVLLSGVHFEYDPFLLNSNDIYIKKIISPLTQFNESRKTLITKLLQMLGLFEINSQQAVVQNNRIFK